MTPQISMCIEGRDDKGGSKKTFSPPKRNYYIISLCCLLLLHVPSQPRVTRQQPMLLGISGTRAFSHCLGLLHVLSFTVAAPSLVLRHKRHPLLSNIIIPVSFILTFYRVISCVTTFSFFLSLSSLLLFSSSFISPTHCSLFPLQHWHHE